MTACCWRLTQPENRRRKKASGGGKASMGPELPRGAPTLQGGPETGDGDPGAGWTPRGRSSCSARRSGNLGRVFAQDGVPGTAAAEIGPAARGREGLRATGCCPGPGRQPAAAVIEAVPAVGTACPTDATIMAAVTWQELDLLDHRRRMVAGWTGQANGAGS